MSPGYCVCRGEDAQGAKGRYGRVEGDELFRRLNMYGAFGFLRSQFPTQWATICVQDTIDGRIAHAYKYKSHRELRFSAPRETPIFRNGFIASGCPRFTHNG